MKCVRLTPSNTRKSCEDGGGCCITAASCLLILRGACLAESNNKIWPSFSERSKAYGGVRVRASIDGVRVRTSNDGVRVRASSEGKQ